MPASPADSQRTADYLAAGHVDGALLVSLHGDDPLPARIAAAGIPMVLVGRPLRASAASYVDVDNRGGARSRRRPPDRRRPPGHRDHRRPARTWPPAIDRLAGYRDALDRGAASRTDPTLEATGDFTQDGGAAAMERLLAARPDIDAVFAASDLMAAGAMSVLDAAGRRVPEDVAVVGYDDSPVATSTTRPQLTSVRQPIEEMGHEMARLLVDARRGLRSRATARDPGHRTGSTRLERREAHALSRPATGGRRPARVGCLVQPHRPHSRWRSIQISQEEESIAMQPFSIRTTRP